MKLLYTDITDKHYFKSLNIKVMPLCIVLNSLPNVTTYKSCKKYEKTPFKIWFKTSLNHLGLHFLKICTDKNYWEYGEDWDIIIESSHEMSKKDQFLLVLESKVVGDEAYYQTQSMISNMNKRLNDNAFMEKYGFKLQDFHTVEEGVKCISCKNTLKHLTKNSKYMKDFLLNDGFTTNISGHYGSKYDDVDFTIAICDKCVKDNLDKGIIELDQYTKTPKGMQINHDDNERVNYIQTMSDFFK